MNNCKACKGSGKTPFMPWIACVHCNGTGIEDTAYLDAFKKEEPTKKEEKQ